VSHGPSDSERGVPLPISLDPGSRRRRDRPFRSVLLVPPRPRILKTATFPYPASCHLTYPYFYSTRPYPTFFPPYPHPQRRRDYLYHPKLYSIVGKHISDLQPGDKVLLSYTSCTHCGSCKLGKPGACTEWDVMNFMRKRGLGGDRPGGSIKGRPEEQKVWGAFFGQSSLSKRAVVARASVSFSRLLQGSGSGLGCRVVRIRRCRKGA
jgi:hypothetical protein